MLDRTYTGKFAVGDRVTNTTTNYTGTVIDVDPISYDPPAGRAVHHPYRVKYDHWTSDHGVWEMENELTALPKRKFNPAWPSAIADVTSKAGKERMRQHRNRFAKATGYATPAKLVAAIESGEVAIIKR